MSLPGKQSSKVLLCLLSACSVRLCEEKGWIELVTTFRYQWKSYLRLGTDSAQKGLLAGLADDVLCGIVLNNLKTISPASRKTHEYMHFCGLLTCFNCEVGPFLASFALRSRFIWAFCPYILDRLLASAHLSNVYINYNYLRYPCLIYLLSNKLAIPKQKIVALAGQQIKKKFVNRS